MGVAIAKLYLVGNNFVKVFKIKLNAWALLDVC
jgi:hypothetical protein